MFSVLGQGFGSSRVIEVLREHSESEHESLIAKIQCLGSVDQEGLIDGFIGERFPDVLVYLWARHMSAESRNDLALLKSSITATDVATFRREPKARTG